MLSLPMTIRAPTTRSAIWQELGGSADRQTIKEAGIPFVLVMRTYPKLTKDAVITDDYQGAYDAVCHLARAGRKRIGLISGPLKVSNAMARWQGFHDPL